MSLSLNEVSTDVRTVEMSSEATKPPVEAYRTLCSHYTRGCSFVSPCCGKVYPCRLCHNEKEATHEIDRYKVSEVVCRKCHKRQPAAGDCTECGISFGRYYCSICHLYADEEKGQFHCDKCGLCRIGGRDNFFHCDMCGYCLPLSMKDSHHCRKQASKDNCPVCMEDLHTSRSAIHPTKCGHLLHFSCYQEMVQKRLYRCPQCQCSLADMTEAWKKYDEEKSAWQMPRHLQNFKVKIKCRDCQQETETEFHVVGFKCSNCGSYNTVRSGNEEFPQDEGEEGEEREGARQGVHVRGGAVFREVWRMIRDLDRVHHREGVVDESSDEESDGESSEGEEEDDIPAEQLPEDSESYDGDESGNEEGTENNDTIHVAGPHAEPESDQATATSLHVEPDSDQATAGPHADPNPPTSARSYGHDSSSEPEWPMSLPSALDHSNWSDSSQSDSHSTHSDSSWETEEVEVTIGGTPND